MADYGWMMLKVWPWDDKWLAVDDELRLAFDEHELVHWQHSKMGDGIEYSLQGAMNGEATYEPSEHGLQEVIVSGEMQGSSYAILNYGCVPEALMERGIAWYLKGDAAHDWDGDETFWHPGMAEPFTATANEGGRVLAEHEFAAMRVLSLPVDERVKLLDAHIEVCRNEVEQRRDLPHGEHVVEIYTAAIINHERLRDQLLADRPEPKSLADLISEFFDVDPFAWKPGPDWAPRLKLEDEA